MSKPVTYKNVNNRNPIKQWFLTFPKVGNCADRLSFPESLPPLYAYICCMEKHQDDTDHLHLTMKLKKALPFKKLLDWIKVKYPNDWKRIEFAPVRNLQNCIDYCKKEDPHHLENGDFTVIKKKRYSTQDAERDNWHDIYDRCYTNGEEKKENLYKNGNEYEILKKLESEWQKILEMNLPAPPSYSTFIRDFFDSLE